MEIFYKGVKMNNTEFKHGMRVTCVIGNYKIYDAKLLSEIEYGVKTWFICQNVVDGGKPWNTSDYFGYKYTYYIGDGSKSVMLRNHIKNLSASDERDIKNIRPGCQIIGQSGEKFNVIDCSKNEKVWYVETLSRKSLLLYTYTLETLKKQGFEIVVEKPEEKLVYLTLEDISKGMGKGVPTHLMRIL